MEFALHAGPDRAGFLLGECGRRSGTRMRKCRRRSAAGIAVRATSADRSKDILVWAWGPRRIERVRVRFPIENVDSRARFQTPIRKIIWRWTVNAQR
jgi:hypothetical protein